MSNELVRALLLSTGTYLLVQNGGDISLHSTQTTDYQIIYV